MSTSVSYDDALQGTHRFRTEVHVQKQELFAALAKGQSPHITFVTCSDSRIDPCSITQSGPGDLFVIRNAGNIVPTSAANGGEIASLEFAVRALKTQHIVVCGHSDCGAMKGLMNPDACAHLKYVASWVREAQPALTGLDAPASDDSSELDRVIKANVTLQLDNLKRLDFVKEAQDKGELSLHGWIYHIGTGEVEVVA